MAKNTFGFGAMGVRPDLSEIPDDPASKRAKIEGIASKMQVPANVLMAMDEAGERDIEGAAGRISQAAKSGMKLEQIVPGAVLSRAYDIADQLYPRKAEPKPEPKGGMVAALSSGIDTLQQGFGSAIEGAGKVSGLSGVERFGAEIAERNAREAEENGAGLTQLSDIDGVGSAAKYAGEVVAQNAPQMGLSIGGGTAGAMAGAAIGSVVPVIGTAAGAVIGGLAGGLTVNLPLFYGQNRERQKEAIERGIKTEIDEGAAFLASIPQAALDSVVDRFLVGKFLKPEVLNAGGLLTRAVRGGASGAIVEVPTEIGQQMIERAQAGLPLDDDEAMAEYISAGVAAGILGGGVGAVSGATARDSRNADLGIGDGSADAGQNAEGVAIPDNGAPSAFDEAGVPAPQTEQDPSEAPALPPAQDAGPISRAAQAAPDLTPVPDAPQMFPEQKPGAPVRLQDPETGEIIEGVFQREEGGNAIVRIGGEEVDIAPKFFDEMLGAARKADLEAEAAKKGAKGPAEGSIAQEVVAPPAPEIAPVSVDESSAQASQPIMPPEIQNQPDLAGPGSSGQADPEADLEVNSPHHLSPGGLAEAAVKSAPISARPKDDPLKDLAPDEAAKRLKDVEDRIRKAKTPRKSLIDLRDRLAEIAGQRAEGGQDAEAQGGSELDMVDVGEQGGADAGKVGRTDAAGSKRDQERAVQGGANTDPVPPGRSEGVADAAPAAEPDAALTQTGRPALKGTPPTPPTHVEPIKTAPADRIQPDMLGGAPVNEDQMALKERTRKEWGRVVGIASGNSSSDEMLEGRDVLIRPGMVVIRAKAGAASDLDYRLDTSGMDRDEIAARLRGALGELDRVSPIPDRAAAATAKPAPVAAKNQETESGSALRRAAMDMGDATDDATSMGADDLAQTLSEAAGDPRIFQAKKLEKDIDRLQRRERIHGEGIANAKRSIRRLQEERPRIAARVEKLRRDQSKFEDARAAGFTAAIDGKTFSERADAQEAFDAVVLKLNTVGRDRISTSDFSKIGVQVQGFEILAKRSFGGEFYFAIDHDGWDGYETIGKPSIASVEAGLRRFGQMADGRDAVIAENDATIDRLTEASVQPFQQGQVLKTKQTQLVDIQDDMRENPVAAPSWLRQGAPVDSLIYVDGKALSVQGHRWTSDGWFVLTEDGPVDYLSATDESGVKIYDERAFEPPKVADGSKMRTGEDGAREMRADRKPVATLQGNELGAWGDVRDLGRKAEAWYRKNLSGQSVVNAATGWKISFANTGAKKSTSGKGEDLLRIIPALRQIIQGGYLISSEPDNRSREGVKGVHRFGATVMLDGRPRDVVAMVRETTGGTFQYSLSRDMSDGARFLLSGESASSVEMTGKAGPIPALEGRPVTLNLDFSPADFNSDDSGRSVQASDLTQISSEIDAEIARHGLAGKVTARVVRGLLNSAGVPILGRQRGNQIDVAASASAKNVLIHEIIHALRDPILWGSSHGLFTPGEWRGLVSEARGRKEIASWVEKTYSDQPAHVQTEEMVAELYREWVTRRDAKGAVGRSLTKVRAFFDAMVSALRGGGFQSAALTMERVASGKVGGRGPQGPGGGRPRETQASVSDDIGAEMRAPRGSIRAKFAPLVGDRGWRDSPAVFSEWLSGKITDNMAGDKASLLGLIPGRALFAELGKGLHSARRYLRIKEEMDAMRDEWHASAATVAQKWIAMQKSNPAANEALMDLMHRSTLTGIDPSKPDALGSNDATLKEARHQVSRLGQDAPEWAKQKLIDFEARNKSYDTIKQMYDALPKEFQSFYVEVKKSYEAIADDFDAALEENIKGAAKIALKRAEKAHRKEMRRIEDDGLTGAERAEAIDAAETELAKAKKRAQMGVNTKIKSLRKVFEGQRLNGPYFPLARFGDFWAVVRDESGKVTNFSRFETSGQQRAFMREQEALHPGMVQGGLLEDKAALRDQVDPKFVADIENMLSDTGASPELMDAIWQRYLETLPDQSIRTSKIHRKGRAGFSRDALRSFTSHMFHGAHQLARLRYGLELGDAMDDAADEARAAKDPNRAMAIVNEMRRRMEWTLAPTNAPWVAAVSSAAFVWYLGVSPAAALVNITQTTVIGPAVMKARFKSAGVGKILAELGGASRDFVSGRGSKITDTWSAENSPNLTADELAALREAMRRGTIDRTQSHDLASVQESGVEFNPVRENIMRKIGWAFHHAERFNREVTFLANYRLARQDGQSHADAIETAADLTWKIHFSYQNSDRPRAMQGDWPKLFMQFRQFTFNTLYRLFRDVHQSMNGATESDRKEARTQLVGISLSMMAHAGIKGVWGYSIIMGLLALFFPGDSDDIEEWMQDALLMEGDGLGVAAWNYAMGAALNGVPGQLAGVSLTERIGAPNLWFRGSDRTLEGEDWLQSYVNELLGPSVGIAFSIARGGQNFADGHVVRGVEAMTPKFVRDIIKAGRYAAEGVNTKNGDTLVENVNPWELFMQLNGFTPARISERYEINSRLKNLEQEILDERQGLHREAGDAMRNGDPIPPAVMDRIRDFNMRFPEYPITGETIRTSMKSRARASARNEFGIALNPKLNDRLREGRPPSIY